MRIKYSVRKQIGILVKMYKIRLSILQLDFSQIAK